MLSVQLATMLVTSSVVCGVLGAVGVLYLLKKKSINIDKGIETANSVIKVAEPVINVADTLLPNNPAVGLLKIIEKWAKIAAGDAQQLSHAGDITKEERATVAENVVNTALKELNIDVNDNRKILIDAAIKDVVNSFGHTDKTEAEKKAEKQALQAQVIQLTTERDSLKNTIATITTSASTVQVVNQDAQ